MKVKKENLFWIAGIVWGIAGYNVLKIGLEEYSKRVTPINILFSVLVFCAFWFLIFKKMADKHEIRIYGLAGEMQSVFKFFDAKSYIIMIVMMSFGIIVRKFDLASAGFIAVFYTGLGSALALAGLYFFLKFVKARQGKAG